jgi:hypothetical protein
MYFEKLVLFLFPTSSDSHDDFVHGMGLPFLQDMDCLSIFPHIRLSVYYAFTLPYRVAIDHELG